MTYPQLPNCQEMFTQIAEYSRLKHEYGSKNIGEVLSDCEKAVRKALREIKNLPVDKGLAASEPNGLRAIRRLCPKGPRRMWDKLDVAGMDEPATTGNTEAMS